MFRVLGLFLYVIFFCFGVVAVAKEVQMPQSTEGIEDLDSSIEKSKPSVEQKNEQKQKLNRSKLYIKNKKNLKQQTKLKTKLEREIEYIEKNINDKSKKLDSLTSQEVKGENE